ncbi:MAG TPA: hypothetical protein VKA60_27570 [Blastocatellia bacterium]|nr:hypothetical protein [Blastocatellia bacterium]
MTTFIGTSASSPIGFHKTYRITFDVSGQGLFFLDDNKLNFIYDHMQDSGAFTPLSPNPTVAGDDVMVVDVVTIDAGANMSMAEAVRRLETVAGGYAGAGSSVRELRVISASDASDAASRDAVKDAADKQNEEDSFSHRAADAFASLGHYGTLAVFAFIAYAAMLYAPTITALTRRRRA